MVSARSSIERDEQLPSYSDLQSTTTAQPGRGAFRTKHSYSLETTKGKPWLSLNVASRAVSPRVLPVFRDGDEISGEVKVDLDKPESYKGITVRIVGEYTTVGQESIPFLDLSTTLWTPTSSSDKLSGSRTWPFSLSLPKEVQVSSAPKEPAKKYPLPPTFSERASPAYIDYKIIVIVKRGMFKVNQTLSTSFAYVPRWVAPPPSPLRIAAYNDGSPLLGPEVDPDGWKVLPPIKVTGTLFDTKSVEVEMTLALATPLSCALGSPIPLHLTLKSTKMYDQQALDILSQPSSQSIFLTRTKVLGSTATTDDSNITQTNQRRSNNTFEEHVGKAYWWPYIIGGEDSREGKGEVDGGCAKMLMGEIDVSKTLNPSFVFPRFSIRYHISIYPISAPGFTPSPPSSSPPSSSSSSSKQSNHNTPLHTERISIVTNNTPGILPRSHAPPGYIKPEEGNYNNSMGYLENGNQRFYGHHR